MPTSPLTVWAEYLEGNAVNKDTTRAVEWFTKSAEAGNRYAQYMLGKLYLTGQGVTRDQAQAMDWFSRSAAQGNQYAQFFLEHQNDLRPPSVMLAATRLLYHMSRIFEDHSLPQSSAGLQVDRKLQKKNSGEENRYGSQAGRPRGGAKSGRNGHGWDVTSLKNYGTVNNKKALGI